MKNCKCFGICSCGATTDTITTLRARVAELERRLSEPGCGEACPVATRLRAERDEARREVESLRRERDAVVASSDALVDAADAEVERLRAERDDLRVALGDERTRLATALHDGTRLREALLDDRRALVGRVRDRIMERLEGVGNGRAWAIWVRDHCDIDALAGEGP